MFRATTCPPSASDDCVMLSPRVGMCCNNEWCYTDMSHCEWAVCRYVGGGFIVVGVVRCVIRLKYIPVAAGRLSRPVGS